MPMQTATHSIQDTPTLSHKHTRNNYVKCKTRRESSFQVQMLLGYKTCNYCEHHILFLVKKHRIKNVYHVGLGLFVTDCFVMSNYRVIFLINLHSYSHFSWKSSWNFTNIRNFEIIDIFILLNESLYIQFPQYLN